jgi:hypothetical protein
VADRLSTDGPAQLELAFRRIWLFLAVRDFACYLISPMSKIAFGLRNEVVYFLLTPYFFYLICEIE